MRSRLSPPPAWLLAAALGAAYLVVDPRSADLAAQEYRAGLGLVVWDDGWYAGHHMPAYSVLFPLLAALLGPALTGVLAVVGATAAFERLAHDRFGDQARAGALWFAVGSATLLLSGRLTFALGLAFALAAVLAAERGRPGLAVGAGVVASVTSPVAGAFLALAAAAWWVVARGWAPVALAAAGIVPTAALTVAFPEGGTFPFATLSFWPALAALAATALALPRDERVLRAGAALYGAAMLASFLLDTPMGGNVVRLGALCAGPVLAGALWGRRPLLLAALALPLLWWQWAAAVGDVARAAGDVSVHAAYYAPLLRELRARTGAAARLEIPFTANHWETRWVAPQVPLARGWERQLDVARNALFYDGRPLTAARYRRWLDANAIAWVALPDAPLDRSARAEAALLRAGLPYLHEVWHDRHWRLFAVRAPAPLVTGPATLTRLGGDEIALRAHAPGVVGVRTSFSPYWRLAQGDGCVERSADGRIRLRLRRAGRVRLEIAFALGRVGADSPRCTRPGAPAGAARTR
jgi:hypothetical protein